MSYQALMNSSTYIENSQLDYSWDDGTEKKKENLDERGNKYKS